MRLLFAAITLIFVLVLPISASACSLAPCVGNGVEMGSTFTVQVTHDGKLLAGVSVEIKRMTGDLVLSGRTTVKGTFNVTKLAPGEYSLSTELLGLSAGSECFHVRERASRTAKMLVKYEWGEFPTPLRQIGGSLFDSQPGQGDSPLWNLVNRVQVPISGAQLKLRNPLDPTTLYNALSNFDGSFSFRDIPNGTYVLHIEGGNGRYYYPADLLVELDPNARNEALLLTRMEGGAGSCSDEYFNLQVTRR